MTDNIDKLVAVVDAIDKDNSQDIEAWGLLYMDAEGETRFLNNESEALYAMIAGLYEMIFTDEEVEYETLH